MARGKDARPGTGRRIDYGLQENTMQVPEHVRQILEPFKSTCKADVLGLRGSQWNSSVWAPPGKFSRDVSDKLISNCYQPENIRAPDFRRTTSPHRPVPRLHSPPLERNATSFARQDTTQSSPKHKSSAWNASTEVIRADVLKGAEEVTKASLKASKKICRQLVSSGKYVTPIERVNLLNESFKASKLQTDEEWTLLVSRYGEEGATAVRLQATLASLSQTSSPVSSSCSSSSAASPARRRPAKASPADIQAVRQLPDYGAV